MSRRSSIRKHKLGQHFLNSERIARRIVDCADIRGESVVEIGAGKGIMTRLIADRTHDVTAIEIDAKFAARLRNEKIPNVTILQKDFLAVNFRRSSNLIVIGNIPYAISSAIISKLLSERASMKRIVLTVQKEFAQRLYAARSTPRYGALTLHVNCYFDVTKEFTIPARFFTPSPKVHSIVVVLEKRKPRVPAVDEKKFFAFVTGIFRYRRKSVKNAIAHFLHCTPDGIERSISMKRPADLSLKDYYWLYSRIVRQ